MRVVVNQLLASGRKTGVGHYTAELLRCLHDQAGDDLIDVFPRPWMQWARKTWTRARSCLEKRINIRRSAHHAGSETMTRLRATLLGGMRTAGQTLLTRHFQALCALHQYDLYHETNYIPLPCDCPTITTVYDLSVLLHPEWHPPDRVRYYERHFQKGMSRCVHFLAISQACRREIIRELHVPPDRVTCTYLGVRPTFRPLPAEEITPVLRQLGLPDRYLLYIGTIEPRKNILRLLQAYCALPERLRSKWPLVLAGGWGWNSSEVADYYQREARHRGVRLAGYIPESRLAAVYNGARALLYPSLYEGFGLPPLEMMACGGAVLGSTADALVETFGGQTHLIAPEDTAGWRDAMQRILDEDDWWHHLCLGAVAVARPYTWERCAAETLTVYRSLAGPTAVPRPDTRPLRAAG